MFVFNKKKKNNCKNKLKAAYYYTYNSKKIIELLFGVQNNAK